MVAGFHEWPEHKPVAEETKVTGWQAVLYSCSLSINFKQL